MDITYSTVLKTNACFPDLRITVETFVGVCRVYFSWRRMWWAVWFSSTCWWLAWKLMVWTGQFGSSLKYSSSSSIAPSHPTKNHRRREKGEEVIGKPKGPNSWKIRHFWHEILACRRSFVLSKWPHILKEWVKTTWMLAIHDCLILICWNNLIACDVLSPTFS